MFTKRLLFSVLAFFTATLTLAPAVYAEDITLLNVSYDPTREFYDEYNAMFAKDWQAKTGRSVKVNQSHGGSAKQARSVMEGLQADVVTLALAYDIDAIAERTGKLPTNWQELLPNNSAPYNSVVVFLVKKGNPSNIRDWDDLVREDVKVITANPKTSGGARWNYLAAWAYALKKNNGDEEATKAYMKALFKNVPTLDSGARGSTTSFTERNMGDVLIAWENEALMVTHDIAKDKFEIIYPSQTILAEPPVALVEGNASKNGNVEVARAYLENLYTPEAQEMAVKHYYRPSETSVAEKYTSLFPTPALVTIADFGGWKAAQEKHFAEGGTFDQIYASK